MVIRQQNFFPQPVEACPLHHFVVIHVDGQKICLDVRGVGDGDSLHPYLGGDLDCQDLSN